MNHGYRNLDSVSYKFVSIGNYQCFVSVIQVKVISGYQVPKKVKLQNFGL